MLGNDLILLIENTNISIGIAANRSSLGKLYHEEEDQQIFTLHKNIL